MAPFVDAAMRPGSREFVIVLNSVLATLFCVMLAVVYTQLEDSIHMFVMLFIVVGLTVSINWFIIEANKLKMHGADSSSSSAAAGATATGAKKNAAARGKTD